MTAKVLHFKDYEPRPTVPIDRNVRSATIIILPIIRIDRNPPPSDND